jgi:hypothetical protein
MMKIVTLALLSTAIRAEACMNFSGKYTGTDQYGSYTAEYSQMGCSSITQTTTDSSGTKIGPITAITDGQLKKFSYSDGTSMTVSYGFTSVGFHSLEINVDSKGLVDSVTDQTVTPTTNGNLNVKENQTDQNGNQTYNERVETRVN